MWNGEQRHVCAVEDLLVTFCCTELIVVCNRSLCSCGVTSLGKGDKSPSPTKRRTRAITAISDVPALLRLATADDGQDSEELPALPSLSAFSESKHE